MTAKKVQNGLLIFPILKDLNAADGILVKNEGIRKGFLQNGVHVDVLEFNTKGIFNKGEQVFPFHPKRYLRICQYNTVAWKRITNYIGQKQYDFLWFRIPMINSFIADFIKRSKEISPECRIIIEYGAYPFLNELPGIKKIFYRLNRANEKKAHRYADFVITYSGQSQVDNLVNIPINNGIDLDDLPVCHPHKDLSQRIRFISVSSLKKWHAYERFIAGLAAYLKTSNAADVHFHIVGNGPEYEKLVKLVNELRVNDHVTFHNFKTGKELDAVYAENHIAIGTLGFHRIGITNSSSLKNREYFARGLPVVLSTTDLDMPEELPFVKYISEGEDAVDIASLVVFAKKMYQVPDLNQQIRKYAEEHLSWKSKIRTVLDYLNQDAIKETASVKKEIYS